MKKSNLTFPVIILLIAFFAAPVFSQSEKADKLRAQIEEMNAKMVQAITEDDHEFLTNMYVEDMYSLPSYSPMLKGREAMVEHEKKNQEAGFKMIAMKFDVVEVIPAGKYAIEIGQYDVTMAAPMMEEPMNDKGKYVTVWQIQEDGSLKIKVETWNTDMNPWMEAMSHDEDHDAAKDKDHDDKHMEDHH